MPFHYIVPNPSTALIPGDARSAEFHHEKTFLLADLAHDAQYECLVQAKNQYGWSEASRIHRFHTHSNAFGTYYNEARGLEVRSVQLNGFLFDFGERLIW